MKLLKVVMIILLTVIVLATGLVFGDGAFLRSKYDLSQDQYDDEKAMMSEIEFRLIRAGIQAASSHNMQPWKIQILDQNTFSLYANLDKALPVIDPENKQLLMSQGTFIGSVRKAAQKSGVMLEVTYHTIHLADELPLIATFKITGDPANAADAVTAATAGIASTAGNLALRKDTLQKLEILSDYETIWIDESARLDFQDYLRKGTAIEAENKLAMEELLQNFRFTKWAKNKYRYGLSLNTMAPLIRMWIEPLIGLTSGWKSFGQSTITTFEQRLQHEDTYLILAKSSPTLLDYIQVGETISALDLYAQGYRLRPAVQLLQPLDGMQEICQAMKNDYAISGEVLQIIGFTKITDSYHESVRHQVLDLIISETDDFDAMD